MITKIENPWDAFTHRQEIDRKVSYLRSRATSLKKIKKIVGAEVFDSFEEVKGLPMETTLTWLRDHQRDKFKSFILGGVGEALLDFRIAKNLTVKSKRAVLLRDINYKELFDVEKAIELHPCYFDIL